MVLYNWLSDDDDWRWMENANTEPIVVHVLFDVHRLSRAHQSKTAPRKIDVRYIPLDRQSRNALDDVFRQAGKHLQFLTLESLTNLETNTRYEVPANAFSGSILQEVSLKSLNLSESASRQLALALHHCNSLSMTDIRGSSAWLMGLRASASLETLCLNDIFLFNDEQQQLLDALVDDARDTKPTSHSLRTLRLESLWLDDDTRIAKLLEGNQRLHELSLARNDIVDVSRLAQGLQENQTLQRLNLSDNPIGDQGVDDLARALSLNRSLQWLNILDCEIWDTGYKTFLQELANFHVREILIGDMDSENVTEDILLESLKTNMHTVRVFASHPKTWTKSQTLLDLNRLGRRFWGETLMMERQLLPSVLSKRELSSDPNLMYEFLSIILPSSL